MKDKYFVDATMLMYAHDIAAVAEHDRAKVLVEHGVAEATVHHWLHWS